MLLEGVAFFLELNFLCVRKNRKSASTIFLESINPLNIYAQNLNVSEIFYQVNSKNLMFEELVFYQSK
jgi:hypothetical protein